MTEEKEIVDLVAKLYKTFKKVGVRNVLNALDGLCRGNINSYDEHVQVYILHVLCLFLHQSLYQVHNTIQLLIYLLKEHLLHHAISTISIFIMKDTKHVHHLVLHATNVSKDLQNHLQKCLYVLEIYLII